MGGFVAIAVIYLVIVQGLSFFMSRNDDVKYAAPADVGQLWSAYLLPVAVSCVFAYGVVAYLGWWRPVWIDDRPVQGWLIFVPILMVLTIVVVTDYSALADKGATFSILLLVMCLLVGLTEETMFRGIGVTVFRRNGFTEGKVALWSTVLFGVAHSTNLISEGPKAFMQVFTTIVAGYFLYIIRRRTGGLLIPALIHGLWDFSLISGQVIPDELYPLGLLAILTMVVLAIVLFVRRRHIEPHGSAT
ncbi:CPBP family intramembrane glutamic endopeptidase [Rhodococcus sp. NPDC057297]|uniref:CPBP family intramembrane glutamic endopeptidase n=1 Tax=Rhodococcus sp. NPDC057297 TaxID=3346090 RepID=UPI0036346575